jgi:hypothetical protein
VCANGIQLPRDRASCLVVDANDQQDFVGALVVKAEGRQRLASHCFARTKNLLWAIEFTFGEPRDEQSDAIHKLNSSGRIATYEKIHRRVEILLGLRGEEDLQRRSLSSTRLKTASAGTPRPSRSDLTAASSPASSSWDRAGAASKDSKTYRPSGSARNSVGTSLPFQRTTTDMSTKIPRRRHSAHSK